jgi:hypothetical protein
MFGIYPIVTSHPFENSPPLSDELNFYQICPGLFLSGGHWIV